MATNVNWDRWIHSSINKYFTAIAATHSLPKLFEGVDTRTETFMDSPHRCEIRSNGPNTLEISSGYYELLVGINLFFTSRMEVPQESKYKQNDLLGIFIQAMQQPISILRLGTGGEDDDTLLGCLTLETGNRDHLKTFHFGQMDETLEYKQAAIDGKYTMFLKV